MKAKSGFFQRFLSFLILIGFLAGCGLVWLGYQKAEKAIDKNPIANLYPTYAGDAVIPADFRVSDLKEVLAKFSVNNDELNQALAFFSDHTVAEVITEQLYLPTDDTVSTAIGQRFVVHRLEKAYSQEELLLICYGLLGYDLKTKIPDLTTFLSSNETEAIKKLSANAEAFLTDILTFLKDRKLIPSEAGQ